MRITIGRILTALGIAAVIALVVWSFMPQPIPVEMAAVTQGKFTATIDKDGKTRVRERYVVAAPLAGQLTRVALKPGDKVKEKDAIASILPSPAPFLDPRSRQETQERLGAAEAARERSKTIVERAQAEYVQAQNDLERIRTLTARGVSTAQALERAETTMRVAERDLRAAEFQDHAASHEVEQARALLARYHNGGTEAPERWTVVAPVAGVVLRVAQESETAVQPGAPILDIGDPRDLEIVVDVLSTEAVEIQVGADVTVEHWGGPHGLAGRVRRIEPAAFTKISTLGVEEQRVNVVIDIVSPPRDWERLGDAYQLDTRITVFARDEAIIIPSGALFRTGAGWSVYVVSEGRAQQRAVELLRRSGRIAAVTTGVGPGDKVIVYPSDRIAPGVRVTAP